MWQVILVQVWAQMQCTNYQETHQMDIKCGCIERALAHAADEDVFPANSENDGTATFALFMGHIFIQSHCLRVEPLNCPQVAPSLKVALSAGRTNTHSSHCPQVIISTGYTSPLNLP